MGCGSSRTSRDHEYELQPQPRRSGGRREHRSAGAPSSSGSRAQTFSSQASLERAHTGINPQTGNIHTEVEIPLPEWSQPVMNDAYFQREDRQRPDNFKTFEQMFFEGTERLAGGNVKSKEVKLVQTKTSRRPKKKDLTKFSSIPENPMDHNRIAYPHGAEGASRSSSMRTGSSGQRTQAGPSRQGTAESSASRGKGKGKARC